MLRVGATQRVPTRACHTQASKPNSVPLPKHKPSLLIILDGRAPDFYLVDGTDPEETGASPVSYTPPRRGPRSHAGFLRHLCNTPPRRGPRSCVTSFC